jgi:uncharacterized protein
MVSEIHGYIKRLAEASLERNLTRSPAVAILGPRQCGKSTLAREFLRNSDAVLVDLENRMDRNKLVEPELFLEAHRHQLVCLDEIQRLPEFFSVLRSEIDNHRQPGRFLILGSASRDLIRQSSESLAGRLAHIELTPFLLSEVSAKVDWRALWLRGGFPDSLLAADDRDSFDWRQDFIRTFLERDIPSLGYAIPLPVIERLWLLLAHYHGQTVNFSKLATAADLSVPTVKKYLNILRQTFMVRLLPPMETNLKKRLVKSPKLYLRDSGILHALLGIEDYDQLLSNPINGPSWEGFALENIIAARPRAHASFVRSSNGAELDLVLRQRQELEVFEFKLSKAPKPSRGFFELVENLKPQKAWVVAPVDEPYEYRKGVMVTNLFGT